MVRVPVIDAPFYPAREYFQRWIGGTVASSIVLIVGYNARSPYWTIDGILAVLLCLGMLIYYLMRIDRHYLANGLFLDEQGIWTGRMRRRKLIAPITEIETLYLPRHLPNRHLDYETGYISKSPPRGVLEGALGSDPHKAIVVKTEGGVHTFRFLFHYKADVDNFRMLLEAWKTQVNIKEVRDPELAIAPAKPLLKTP